MLNPAYLEGEAAYHDGKPETANPYDPNDSPEDHAAWNDGWLDTAHIDQGYDDGEWG